MSDDEILVLASVWIWKIGDQCCEIPKESPDPDLAGESLDKDGLSQVWIYSLEDDVADLNLDVSAGGSALDEYVSEDPTMTRPRGDRQSRRSCAASL